MLTENIIESNINSMYKNITKENADDIINLLEK